MRKIYPFLRTIFFHFCPRTRLKNFDRKIFWEKYCEILGITVKNEKLYLKILIDKVKNKGQKINITFSPPLLILTKCHFVGLISPMQHSFQKECINGHWERGNYAPIFQKGTSFLSCPYGINYANYQQKTILRYSISATPLKTYSR